MNLVYNASAGTGKTYQVTQRYEQLVLEQEIDPRQILLMTFTDNAAAELRTGVTRRLLQARREAEAAGHDEKAERALMAINHLPSAPIGTIHAYCTRLLREQALEAGLSPSFSVLTGDDRDALLQQIAHDKLLLHLETDPHFKTFCTGAHLIGDGGGFGSSLTETVPNLISQAGSLGISLAAAETMLPAPKAAGSLPAFSQILERLRELPKRTPTAEAVLQALAKNLPEAIDVDTLAQALQQESLKKFGRGKGQKSISDDFSALLADVESAHRYKERFPAAQAFARYVQAVAQHFQQRKHIMDAVDFDDQLQMAVQLLQSGAAQPTFTYVIVDEVQDTSRVQYDLIRALWSKTTHLIVCGDPKQSIYTWRGADPQVMPDLAADIDEKRNLKISYRSKAPILDIVNKLFASVYGADTYSSNEQLEPHFITEGEKPCVEFLAPDADLADAPKSERVEAEMEAVAHRIQQLVHGPSEWQPHFRYAKTFQPTDASNRYRYSDVLILLRRTTHQSALEHALRQAHIPYTLGGKGRGLFTRQEVRDVSLFLNVLTNPADIYSLVGFLRSPWVGLSDETIAKLAWSESGFSAKNLQANVAKKTDVIDRYRAALGVQLASELVRMLIDETGFDALQAGLPRGTQRLANLRKILDWLREHERGAQTTPAAVARKLAEQIRNPPPVPEAALLDPAQNAVTIMTVHGSKGLTQRVVVLPDLSFQPNADRAFARVFYDEKNAPTLGVRITAPDRSKAESTGFKSANTRARAIRDHELKNLFYVAMTRARDLVITSATAGKKPDGWLKHITPLIDSGDIPSIPYSTLRLDSSQQEEPLLPTYEALSAVLSTLSPPPKYPSLQRIPATRLAKELATSPQRPVARFPATSAAFGSLGHAVLEQLALNDWNGDIPTWIERLRDDFQIETTESNTLLARLEQTRNLMRQQTALLLKICPEMPFVLFDDNQLIDGTIDLLGHSSTGLVLFDYKFTEAEDTALIAAYRGQMEVYQKAAQKIFAHAQTIHSFLMVISAQGVRQVPMVI